MILLPECEDCRLTLLCMLQYCLWVVESRAISALIVSFVGHSGISSLLFFAYGGCGPEPIHGTGFLASPEAPQLAPPPSPEHVPVPVPSEDSGPGSWCVGGEARVRPRPWCSLLYVHIATQNICTWGVVPASGSSQQECYVCGACSAPPSSSRT